MIATFGAVVIVTVMLISAGGQRETSAEPAASVSSVSQHDQSRFQDEDTLRYPYDAPPTFSPEEGTSSAKNTCTYHPISTAHAPMD